MNLFSTLFKPILFFLLLIPFMALANNSQPHYSVGLDLGLAKPTHIGNYTTFRLGYSTFSYGSDTNDASAFMPGISINKILTITPLYTLQVGVSVRYLSNINVKGNLEQGISPPFYQSTYSYNINSYQYLVNAKLSHPFCNCYFPYIYLGLGLATNSAHSYSTAVPGYLTVTPDYRDKTTNSFTYNLGLGVDYFVIPKLSVGFGYQFINLGKIGLGSGVIRNNNVGAKLTQSNLYMNTFLVQLNYFI